MRGTVRIPDAHVCAIGGARGAGGIGTCQRGWPGGRCRRTAVNGGQVDGGGTVGKSFFELLQRVRACRPPGGDSGTAAEHGTTRRTALSTTENFDPTQDYVLPTPATTCQLL